MFDAVKQLELSNAECSINARNAVHGNACPPSNFFDPGDFPFLEVIDRNFDLIREEALSVVQRYRYLIWRYGDLFRTRERGCVEGARATHYFQVYGMRLEANCLLSPQTSKLVESIPGLVTAGFYILDAHSRILPHVGATSDVLRGHLGVVCPPGCTLRVGAEVREWSERGFLVFDDTVEHEAQNKSNDCRCILLFDFFRESIPEERRDKRMVALQRQFLTRRDYPWLLAADISCNSHLHSEMEEELNRNPMLGGMSYSSILRIVRQSGLYTP